MKENKMGVMPIGKLIMSMSLPIMISMLVQALYNIIDSIFVAQISENALSAVSMAFPLQSLMIAVGSGTGVGVNALLARSLGEKDYDKVNKVAENGVFLAVASYVLFLVIGLLSAEPFFRSQTDIEEIVIAGKEYLTVCCCMSFGLFTQLIFERMLQATGKTFYSMITQAMGAIINIILDPILIFGLLGFPKMGIAGAALATVIGQVLGALLAIYFNHKKNHEIQIQLKGFRPDMDMIKQIYGIAVPAIVMQAIGSIMTYGVNRILISFTATATAVFGVYFKLQSFVFMPVFGLNNGVIPIMAYNYGAGNRERVTSALKHCLTYAVSIMVIGFLIFQIIPNHLLGLFSASDTMIAIGVPALRIISIGFIPAGISIAISSAFQALGKAVYSMCNSIIRQLVVLLPAAYMLSLLGDVNLIWWAFPAAEIVALIISLFFLSRIYKKIIVHIGAER